MKCNRDLKAEDIEKSEIKKNVGLKCLYSNADQLLNKMEYLKARIASDEPDIMLFNEVIPKAQKNSIAETQVDINGYQVFKNFNYDDENLGASGIRGVAIYVKENITCEEIKLQSPFRDHVWIEISLKNNDKLLCGCVYRSPSNDNNSTRETTSQVCKVINEAANLKTSHMLIVGDFNYPRIDWENEHVDENSDVVGPFLNELQSNFLHQHITKPTRYRDGQQPHLLDLILTNEEGMINDISHNPPLGESDHECLNFTLECYHDDNHSESKEARNFYKADYKTIRERLAQIDWETELQEDFTLDYIKFTKILELCMVGCIPTFKIRMKKRSMYLSKDAIRLKDLKRRLWKKFKNSNSQYDRNRYVQTKNTLRTLTRSMRVQFESGIAGDIKTAPKKFWAYVKSRTKTRSKIPTLRRADGSNAVEANDKAETLNDFFISNFTEERINDMPASENDTTPDDHLDTFTITADTVLRS